MAVWSEHGMMATAAVCLERFLRYGGRRCRRARASKSRRGSGGKRGNLRGSNARGAAKRPPLKIARARFLLLVTRVFWVNLLLERR